MQNFQIQVVYGRLVGAQKSQNRETREIGWRLNSQLRLDDIAQVPKHRSLRVDPSGSPSGMVWQQLGYLRLFNSLFGSIWCNPQLIHMA